MKNRNLKPSDNWKTPPEFYNKLNDEFSFNFDLCPYSETTPILDDVRAKLKELEE